MNSKQKWNNNEHKCACKKLDDWDSCKNYCLWNLSTFDVECNNACKTGEYLNINTCLCKKRLFGKLLLAFGDEILNATETLINNKEETCEKK